MPFHVALQRFCGTYQGPWKIGASLEDGRLVLGETPLVPVSANRFEMVDQALWAEFVEDEAGQPVRLVFHQGQMTEAFARVED